MASKNDKEQLLKELSINPIIQVACKKVGVARSTYYRFREDKDFAKKADEAINEGIKMVNDMAESQLISGIRDKNTTSIIFWLKNRHSAYGDKIKIQGKLDLQSQKLTPEQEALMLGALKLGFAGQELKVVNNENKENESK